MEGRVRRTFRVGGALVLLAGAAAAGIYWYQRGPGLEREVERLVAAAGLRPGTTAAEIGAGSGRMAVLVAQHLGAGGRLYVTELEAPQLEAIRQRVAGLGNVIVLPAGQDSTNLEAGCCDVIFMRRVYHHLTAPAAINRSIRAALRPGGRLVVIDFLTPRWAFWTRHGIAADEVAKQIAAAGLEPAGRFERWSLIDYGLVFRKAGGDARFGPGPAGSFDETAVKDPSIAQFERIGARACRGSTAPGCGDDEDAAGRFPKRLGGDGDHVCAGARVGALGKAAGT